MVVRRATMAFTFALIAMCALHSSVAAAVPAIEHPVTDTAEVLTTEAENAIAQRIVAHRNATSIQIAVLLVPTTAGVPIDDYSMQVAQQWRGGHPERNNGVLITFAIRDHHSRIEVGYGLEASLPDSRARGILDGLRPELRAGDYAGAAMHAVEAVISSTGGGVPGSGAAASDPGALPSSATPSSVVTFPTLHFDEPTPPPPEAAPPPPAEDSSTGTFVVVIFGVALAGLGLAVLFLAMSKNNGSGGGTYSSSGGSWGSGGTTAWPGNTSSSSDNSPSFWSGSSSSSSSSSYDSGSSSSSSSSYDSGSSSSSSDNSSSGSGDGGSFGGGGASSDW